MHRRELLINSQILPFTEATYLNRREPPCGRMLEEVYKIEGSVKKVNIPVFFGSDTNMQSIIVSGIEEPSIRRLNIGDSRFVVDAVDMSPSFVLSIGTRVITEASIHRVTPESVEHFATVGETAKQNLPKVTATANYVIAVTNYQSPEHTEAYISAFDRQDGQEVFTTSHKDNSVIGLTTVGGRIFGITSGKVFEYTESAADNRRYLTDLPIKAKQTATMEDGVIVSGVEATGEEGKIELIKLTLEGSVDWETSIKIKGDDLAIVDMTYDKKSGGTILYTNSELIESISFSGDGSIVRSNTITSKPEYTPNSLAIRSDDSPTVGGHRSGENGKVRGWIVDSEKTCNALTSTTQSGMDTPSTTPVTTRRMTGTPRTPPKRQETKKTVSTNADGFTSLLTIAAFTVAAVVSFLQRDDE